MLSEAGSERCEESREQSGRIARLAVRLDAPARRFPGVGAAASTSSFAAVLFMKRGVRYALPMILSEGARSC